MSNKKKKDNIVDSLGVILFASILMLLLFSITQNVLYYNMMRDIEKNYKILLEGKK